MMWNHSKGQKREPELAIMEGRGILVKTKRRSVGKAGLRVTILVADGLSARQDHSPYVKVLRKSDSHCEISELAQTGLRA